MHLKVPTFKAHLNVSVISGEGVLVLTERDAHIFFGTIYEKLIPFIDGRHSVDAIISSMHGVLDPARIYFALDTMQSKGFLVESTPHIPVEFSAFWHAQGIDPEDAVDALGTKHVTVDSYGEISAEPMIAALEANGIQVGNLAGAELRIVLVPDYLSIDLDEINKASLHSKVQWLLVRWGGPELWLGPLFQPGKTGCWACMHSRLEKNRALHMFSMSKRKGTAPPLTSVGSLLATRSVVCQMTSVIAAQVLSGHTSAVAGKILSLDWMSFSPTTHHLARNPMCHACGNQEPRVSQPIHLQSRLAPFRNDCGHRTITPEQTLEKYQHLISPITGVVRVLTPVLEDGELAYVYTAGHNQALKVYELYSLKHGLRNANSGKGASRTQAKASALCEALERFSGERNGTEVIVTGSYDQMIALHGKQNIILPNTVMHFSEQQFAQRALINSQKSKFNRIPAKLPNDVSIDWTPVWSLKSMQEKYLPTQLLYYSSTASTTNNEQYCVGCSNGCASGNSLEEAILHGFFELVERDAAALWWYNRLGKQGVSIQSFGDSRLVTMVERYRTGYGREAWALDLTSDLGIPVFVAVSRLIERTEERILFGLGCHLDPQVALQRAFAEMGQMLGIAQTDAEDRLLVEDAETIKWLRHSTVNQERYLLADPKQPSKALNDFPVNHSGDLLKDIEYCRSLIENKGMEILVLDQTRPDLGIPVVKVVVPGLRHFWSRLGPGRLYEVPIQMGWSTRPTPEHEMNPIPIFI